MVRSCFLLFGCLLLRCIGLSQSVPLRSQADLQRLLAASAADTNRISILLDLSLSFVLKPGAEASDMTKALKYADQALTLSQTLGDAKWEVKSNLVISSAYREQGDKAHGEKYVQRAIEVAAQNNWNALLGDAYLESAGYYNAFEDKERIDKIRIYEQARSLYEQSGEKLKLAGVLKDLADFHQMQGHFDQAVDELKQSLALYNELKFPRIQGVYDLLGTVMSSLENYEQALKYNLLAVETAEAVQDTSLQLCTIYNRLGVTLHKMDQFAQADIYFQKAFSIALKYDDLVSIQILTPNIVNTLTSLKKTEKALAFLKSVEKKFAAADINEQIWLNMSFLNTYRMLRQYANGRPYYQRLLSLADKTTYNGTLKLLYRSVIQYLQATGQYEKAYPFIEKYKNLSGNSFLALASIQLWYFKADSARGNFISAIRHLKDYKTFRDSVSSAANSKQIARLQVEYETSKKDKDLLLKEQNIQLLRDQGRLRDIELKQSNLIKNATFGGLALLLGIVGLLYNRYRLKQRSEKRLENQQKVIHEKNVSLQRLLDEKEWLIKEIHHRVKNNLQIAISLLNAQMRYVDNEVAVKAIQGSQQRIQAMSLIHQKLYQTDQLTLIDMNSYIRELLNYLDENFNTSHKIHFDVQVDNIHLEVTQAVPVGLILNEAITNAIKYAFPENGNGLVSISMQHQEENRLLLSIIDNGAGLAPGFDAAKSKSLGMSLMQGLAIQLNGTFEVISKKGLSVLFVFPLEKKINPVYH